MPENETQEVVARVTMVYFLLIELIAVMNGVVYIKFTFLYETCMITGKSFKSYMTVYDYRKKRNSGTRRLGDSGVFFILKERYSCYDWNR